MTEIVRNTDSAVCEEETAQVRNADRAEKTAQPAPQERGERAQRAMDYFLQGYNCTQSLVLSFADLTEVDRDTLMKLACSFGGGMGRLREVCGSVSGAFMVLGLLTGYSGPETGKTKAEHYARIQEFARRFEAENGSIVCRKLLGLKDGPDSPVPEARTAEYYKKRPCRELIGCAAQLLDTYLAQLREEAQGEKLPED